MARTLYRLTEKIVRKLTAPGYHADGGGLYLQVSKAGTKSWVFRFTLKGRTRDMGLGSAQTVSLTEVRATAGECRTLLAKSLDPIEHAKAEREGQPNDEHAIPTGQNFRDFAEQYIVARADTEGPRKSRRDFCRGERGGARREAQKVAAKVDGWKRNQT